MVPDDPPHPRRVGVRRARVDPAAAEPVVVGRVGVGGDDDVVALADADEHAVGGVGRDGHEIGGDDGQGVAVEGELEVGVGGDVDEAEEVGLARGEDGFEAGAEGAGAALFLYVESVSQRLQDTGAYGEFSERVRDGCWRVRW